ncbi:protein Spindly [Thrips palmi]|uniref:Protein Spindly n=1 Tax=Thrips palmi TaxID=161013 RepID=A0A6P8YH26_THRPL|nr:protein Spindly [Thrips palmi]XP_034239061.1 protein Spindly [Thrips palmi]
MSDISGHNDSSILREFSSQYEDICSQNKEQAGIIEALQQEVHSLKNRLQVAEKIQLDYQSELDCQQQQINDANDLASIAALKLKEDHAIIVKGLEDKVHSLESELQEVTNALAATKDELLKAKKEIKDCQDVSPVASLKTQLQELMEEHAANRLACVQHLELNQVLLKEKAYLVDELNATREHLEITGEKLKICKEDMLQQSETLEDLRESLAVAQNELTCLQSGPPPEKQGNSLFAEVEDKRQAILARNKVLSKRYIEMKMDYGSKCDEISKLKMENLKLRQKWRDEAEERDNRDVWLKDNYEIRIQELYKLVEDLRREEKPVFVNGNAQILAYADQYVDEKKKEIVKLREEMELRSATRLNEAKALYLARSKVQTLNAEVMLLNAENLVLRDKLNEANITDIPSPGKTVKRIKEVWGSVTEAKSCSPLEETLKSCSYVDETSCNSVSKTPEPSSSEAPTACEETNTTQSQSEEPSCPPPISSNQTSISSIIRSIPKPQRLLRIERMEKLNAVSNDEEKSQPESATCGISPDGSDVST